MRWRRRQVTEQTEVTPPPRRPLLWPWLLLLLLILVTGLVGAYLLTSDSGTDTKGPTSTRVVLSSGVQARQVPDLVGLSAVAAFERLQSLGLKGRAVKGPSSLPKDQVIRQLPAPGTNVKPGATVAMVLSKGPPGPTTTTTTTTTTTARTTTTTTTTTTTPGSRPKKGGTGSNTVPNVVGKGQQSALATLRRAGLAFESFPVASARPRGIVVSQSPKAGQKVAPKTPVRVGVSLGPGKRPLRVVPDLIGMTQAKAQATLSGVGFTVRVVSRGTSNVSEDGIVLDQDPAAGTRASTGSQIVIVVGRIPSASS